MRRQTLVVWSSICFCLLLVLVVAKDIGGNDDEHLKVSIRRDTLNEVPSCQHTFSQIELLNSVSAFECRVILFSLSFPRVRDKAVMSDVGGR